MRCQPETAFSQLSVLKDILVGLPIFTRIAYLEMRPRFTFIRMTKSQTVGLHYINRGLGMYRCRGHNCWHELGWFFESRLGRIR